ncbi:FMN-binding protein [Oryzihumus sp.]|uniref:FMN-binding protein n=1 Tax=Oryzihumus sp. TaxID=1968903 RepID=UPI002ED93659
MRLLTGAAVAVAGAAALITSWEAGAQQGTSPVAGVHVAAAAPPPAPAKAGAPRAAGSSGKSPASGSTSTRRSVTGALVSTPYGTVQVKAVLVGTRLKDVVALKLTDSSSTSVGISGRAAPVLRQEAISAQSARIDSVSGATFTSEGYKQSLQAALDAAHA